MYGKNEGLKNQTITSLIKDQNITQKYDEKEIIDNPYNFIQSNIVGVYNLLECFRKYILRFANVF